MKHHPDAHWSYHVIGHYVDAILANKVDFTILGNSVINGLLLEKYLTLLNRKEIVPIEQLTQKQKMELWEDAKKVGTTKDEQIKIAKCIYIINDIAQTFYCK